MSDSGKQIGKVSLILMASVFLSRVLGLVREMAIAWIGGVGSDVDAYQIAFLVPEILNHASGSGFLSITFIPIFTRFLVAGNEEEGWRSFWIILCGFGLLMTAALGLAWVFTEELLHWLAPGLQDPHVLKTAVRMSRILLPAQGCFFIGGLLSAVQYARGRFLFPALAPLIYNAGIITGGLLLGRWIGMEGFSWGVLTGALVGHLVLQWFGARRVGMRWYGPVRLRHPVLRQYLLTTLPLILGMGMSFSTEIFYRFFGSYLTTGSIAAINYGLRIVFMLAGVFGQAVGTASYPHLSRLAAEGNMAELNRVLGGTIRYLAFIIPVSVLLIVLRHEIVTVLFQRGHFDLDATQLTASLLPWILIGSFAFSAQSLVVRGYYALQNTLTPSLLGTAVALGCIPLFFWLMKALGAAGVAFGLSAAAWLQIAILYGVWARAYPHPDHVLLFRSIGTLALVSAGIWMVLEPLRRGMYAVLPPMPAMVSGMLVCCGVGMAFLLMMTLIGRWVHLEGWQLLLRKIGRF
ncbi:MAG: murein biosynthesis integral membrane protein MurJ [Thermodesulfobacteriota bacterium]